MMITNVQNETHANNKFIFNIWWTLSYGFYFFLEGLISTFSLQFRTLIVISSSLILQFFL